MFSGIKGNYTDQTNICLSIAFSVLFGGILFGLPSVRLQPCHFSSINLDTATYAVFLYTRGSGKQGRTQGLGVGHYISPPLFKRQDIILGMGSENLFVDHPHN